jgi:predicted DNA-binding protein (UPF0251 family)
MPERRSFGPLDGGCGQHAPVGMTVDEYETIRLIDLAGLSQEDCARFMGVARTTVQTIYNSAREKLAECLVRGRTLNIGGGSYVLCGSESCACGHCQRNRCRSAGEGA